MPDDKARKACRRDDRFARRRMVGRPEHAFHGRIEIDVTIDDPNAYTKPGTVRVNWRLGEDEDLTEFICHENNRDTEHTLFHSGTKVWKKSVAISSSGSSSR